MSVFLNNSNWRNKYIFWVLCQVLLIVACQDKHGHIDLNEQIKHTVQTIPFVNTSGDTLLTGVPIPITEKQRGPATLVKPKIISIPSTEKIVPAHPHIHPAGEPKVVPMRQELKRFTPGENGLPYPDTLPAHQTVVPALHSKPLTAAPLQMRDNAVTNIQYLSVEEGLTNNIIHSVLEDSRGILWFGSRDETLTQYDGKNLTFFHNWEDVPEHGFTNLSLLEDKNGHIWFGTRAGLGRYDGNNFTYFSNEDSYRYNGVTRLILDSQGNIWFGTRNLGVGRFDGQSFIHYSSKAGLSHNHVMALLEDSHGNLWFGTEGGGLTRFDGSTFTHITIEDGLCYNSINAILEDRQGHLWFATNGGGVCRLNTTGTQKYFSHYTVEEGLSSNTILSLFEDSQGHLWLGTFYMGLNRFDGKTFAHFDKENGMNSTNASAIIEDSYGNIWVGTDEGVHRFGIPEFQHYNQALSSVNDIEEDGHGNIWFAVSGGWPNGVVRFDDSTFRFFMGNDKDLDFLNVGIHALAVDRQDNIWLGSGNRGVAHFNPDKEPGFLTQFNVGENWSNFLISIIEDSRGDFWFGTLEGLRHFDGKYLTKYITPAGPGIEFNLAGPIAEDDEQNIWFGHLQYLGGFASTLNDQRERDSFICFTKKEGMPHSLVVDMSKDKEGKLWVGTEGGVSSFDDGRFTNFTQEDGLVHRKVYSLEIDSAQNIWAGTQNGLSLLVPNTSDAPNATDGKMIGYKIYNFEKEDGLKQADFLPHSSFLDSKNRIWWGKTKGAMMLDLNQLKLPHNPPMVRILHIDVKQQFIDYRRLSDTAYAHTLAFGEKLSRSFEDVVPFYNYPLHMRLPYDLNHLTFHFSGIDWASPHQLRYRYLLENLDKDWSLPQRELKVEYHNLPPNTYTLKVKAIGAAQVWSEPFEYTFTILPPWWQTWWAYAIYVIGSLALVIAAYLYQRRRWQLQSQLQLEQEKAEQLKELDQFKSRFYTNITHEFRTPLTVIKGMANQIGNEKIKTLIQRNSDRLLNMVNQLLDLTRLEAKGVTVKWEQGDIIPYLQYLTESCHSLTENKKINLSFFSTEKQVVMDFDEKKVRDILINLLSNAIKYTPEYGSVKVIVTKVFENGVPFLKLTVKDTGRGIPEDKLAYIFDRFYQVERSSTRWGEGSGIGLALVKELVHLLEGRIEVESEMGKGSDFLVFLPIYQKALKKASTNKAFRQDVGIDNTNHPEQTVLPSESSPNDIEKTQVLIIEDNTDVTEYIISCFNEDYFIQTARNGKEGLEKALEIIPDVILCDVMMPEMDGFEVCRRLKTDRRSSHIPIVILTAKATQEDKITGLSHGADAYLIKPFDKEELLIRLRNLTAQSKRLQERLSDPTLPNEQFSELESREAAFLQEFHQIIEDNMNNEQFDIHYLCRSIAMSRSQLHRKLKALIGQSTGSYVRFLRLKKAKFLLETTAMQIGEIALQVGFKDFSHFSRSFFKEFGNKPSDTRK